MISSILSGNSQGVIQNKNDKSDEQIKVLRHQQEAIQKQIDNIKNGDADLKTKQELIAPLEEQIQNIDAQIQQKQMEQGIDKDNDSKVKKESTFTGTTEESEKLSRDTLFFNMSSTYEQIRSVNLIRKGLVGKSRVLASEASLDSIRGNTKSAERKNGEAASLRGRVYTLESKIGKLNSDINDNVKDITDKTKEKGSHGVNENSKKDLENIPKGDEYGSPASDDKSSIDILA